MKKVFLSIISLIFILLPVPFNWHFIVPDGFYLFSVIWCAGIRPQSYSFVFMLIGILKDLFSQFVLGFNFSLYILLSLLHQFFLLKFSHQTYLFRWVIFSLISLVLVVPGPQIIWQLHQWGFILVLENLLINLLASLAIWLFIGHDNSAVIGYKRAGMVCQK